jgi:hypothetical protein
MKLKTDIFLLAIMLNDIPIHCCQIVNGQGQGLYNGGIKDALSKMQM